MANRDLGSSIDAVPVACEPAEAKHPFFRGLLIGGAVCLILWAGAVAAFLWLSG
jgi:hypothetical protein